jgi:plastocyanin domain-containing protein|tara:strand:+ start:2397 stop:2582 length:186 start_codon:yes stop_codon:yes gene_type:complete
MKTYTLRIRYSSKNDEIYEIEEEIEEEGVYYNIDGAEMKDLIEDMDLFYEMQMGTTDIALT